MANYIPFSDRALYIFQTIDWLKQDYGLTVDENAPLGQILRLALREKIDCQQSNASASGFLTRAQIRAIRGLEKICMRLIQARDTTGIPPQFKKWIRQIGVGIPSLCSPYDDFSKLEDSRQAEWVRQASTDIFELVVGLAALEMGTNVLLESVNSQSKPDVRVQITGVTWGLACRVSNSSNPVRHFGIIADAVKKTIPQLNAGLADYAVIVLCVQNVYPRQILTLPDDQTVTASLKRRAAEFVRNIQEVIPAHRIDSELIKRDERIVPGAILYFEDVLEVGTFNWGMGSLGKSNGPRCSITFTPSSYAQYITFGDRGMALKDVPEQLSSILAGPGAEDIGSIYD